MISPRRRGEISSIRGYFGSGAGINAYSPPPAGGNAINQGFLGGKIGVPPLQRVQKPFPPSWGEIVVLCADAEIRCYIDYFCSSQRSLGVETL